MNVTVKRFLGTLAPIFVSIGFAICVHYAEKWNHEWDMADEFNSDPPSIVGDLWMVMWGPMLALIGILAGITLLATAGVGRSSPERNWAAWSHYGGAFAGPLAPMATWVRLRWRDDPFVEANTLEAANLQLSLAIYAIVGMAVEGISILIFFPLAILVPPMLLGGWIFAAALQISAGVNAFRGQCYRYPYCLRLLRPR